MKIKRVMRGLSFLCIIMLTVSTLLSCQNALDLKFNVKKGDKYKVTVTSVQKIAEEINGQKLNINQTLKTGYTYDIKDVAEDGTVTTDIKYDSVSVKMDSGAQNYEYDSSKPAEPNDAQALSYGAIIGQGFTAKIGKDGKIKEVTGIDKLFANMTDKLQNIDQATKNSLLENLKQSFGDEAMKESLGSMTSMYPENGKIKVGDSWENKQTISVGYPMTLNNKWTMKEDNGDIITLDVETGIDADNSAKPMVLMGMKVKYTLKGTQKGTMKLTRSNGFIQSGEVNQNITGTMAFEANEALPNGLSVPMTLEAKTSYEVTKQ